MAIRRNRKLSNWYYSNLRLCILELSRRKVVRPGVQYEREERLSEELKEATDMVKLVRRSKAGRPLIKH